MPETALLNAALLNALPLEEAAPPAAYREGERLVRDGRVQLLARSGTIAHLQVREGGGGSRKCGVNLRAVPSRTGGSVGALTVDCDCPGFEGVDLCPHIVAAVLALRATLQTAGVGAAAASSGRRPAWESVLSSVLQDLSAEGSTGRRSAATASRGLLFFSIQERASGRWGVYLYSLPGGRLPAGVLGEDGAAPDPDAVARAVKTGSLSGAATAVRTFDPARFPFAGAAERQAASALALTNQYGYYAYYAPSGFYEQTIPLLAGSGFVYRGTEQNPLKQRLDVLPEGAARAALAVNADADGGLRLAPALLGPEGRATPLDTARDRFVFREPPYLLTGKGRLVPLGAAVPAAFRSLVERQQQREDGAEITVPPAARERFFEEYLLPLAERLPLTGDGIVWEEAEEATAPPVPRLYLSEAHGELRAHLRFAYGDREAAYDPLFPDATIVRGASVPNALRRLSRDPAAEQARHSALAGPTFGLKRDAEEPGAFVLRARTTPVDFLLHHAPRLTSDGYELFGEENLKSVRVNRGKPTFSFGVSSGIDWFDVEAVLKFGDVEAALADVRRAIRSRERYVKLADGSIGEIPAEWVERFRFLFALGEDTPDGLRLSATQALLLDQAIADADSAAEVDAAFQERRERLRAFERIAPKPLPAAGLNATLYPYQKAGYDWLHFLHDYGFGGCLADEMGLGKTLSALSLLLSLRQPGPKGEPPHAAAPDLVVVPRSLLFNWEREARRFTPDLRVRVHADNSRIKDPKALTADCDLIVTTYGILLRDIETLRKVRFHYAILDEAQAIKNPLSQTGRAARLLDAEHRLTLTGTPVENGTVELWSQFAFLNPGLLGGLERFKSEFSGAIERRQDEAAAKTLRALTAPFLLRRTKDQVAKDLPPRTEHLVTTEMEPAQRKLYDKLRDRYRAQVLGVLDEKGGGGAQLKILEGLLRLRQVCCHPRLVESDFKGESAKMTAILEGLETLRAEGHKALVFSQFTQMLALLREELDARAIPYLYLDGRTRDRKTPVDRFQSDPSIPFFLISLKAGGVGLNLTAADYVLHVDPWWNPAVERQATDRTHRIGQDKPVFVYKYVTHDSVEEKILTLQERKRTLVDQLISAEGGLLKSLTRDDIAALFS